MPHLILKTALRASYCYYPILQACRPVPRDGWFPPHSRVLGHFSPPHVFPYVKRSSQRAPTSSGDVVRRVVTCSVTLTAAVRQAETLRVRRFRLWTPGGPRGGRGPALGLVPAHALWAEGGARRVKAGLQNVWAEPGGGAGAKVEGARPSGGGATGRCPRPRRLRGRRAGPPALGREPRRRLG